MFPLLLHTDCLTACNQTQSNSNKGTINKVLLPVSEILFLAYCFNLYILLCWCVGECERETLLSQIMQWKLQSSSFNELITTSFIMLGILDVMVCVCFCNSELTWRGFHFNWDTVCGGESSKCFHAEVNTAAFSEHSKPLHLVKQHQRALFIFCRQVFSTLQSCLSLSANRFLCLSTSVKPQGQYFSALLWVA